MQTSTHHKHDLRDIARKAMISRGLIPDFTPAELAEAAHMHEPAAPESIRDLRSMLWCSIDNDSSRDLDQLSVSETLPNGNVKILVAIADVDSLVKQGSALDGHAQHNTTSVYTPAIIFPMLPEKLSTDLTSLNGGEDRPAMVIEMVIAPDGSMVSSDIYRALVHNYAKLAYNSVAAWLTDGAPMPAALAAVPGMDQQLRTQDKVAQNLKQLRHLKGALDLETVQTRPVFAGETLTDLQADEKNRAKELIEDFMIAANGVTANFLKSKNVPSLRRIVRAPERWLKIVALAATLGEKLPDAPDAVALDAFLAKRRAADPLRFPDLSLTVVKLMGRGEYVVSLPGAESPGHFGLAVNDYTHSTAPNRRFPDLLTQRMLKAAIAGTPQPYPADVLAKLAQHCSAQEDAASKVERQVRKSAAALLLEHRIGERFDAIVTGANDKGTWVRIFTPPVEGKLNVANGAMKVGARVNAKLLSVDVERGFIDFGV